MYNIYKYFSDKELSCHGVDCCGGLADMNHVFMIKLLAMRRELGFPFYITSAYRCPQHNSRISSTGDTGPHTTGQAVDILCMGHNAYRLIESALRHGMTGIGIKQKGPQRFIHVDDITGPVRPWIWSY